MTSATLRRKPDAGNLHVRFDEGEVAPCAEAASRRRKPCRRQLEGGVRRCAATPRRWSLFYNITRSIVSAASAPVAVSALAVLPLAVFGATVEVTSVAELTNAVATAKAGDTIRLMKSGSPYVFNDEWMGVVTSGNNCGTNFLNVSVNLTFEGEDGSSRSGWTDHDEPVIVDGGGKGRILSIASGKTVEVKNIAFTGGYCCYGSANSYGGVAYNAGTKANVTFTNCVFRQNSAKTGGGALFSCVLRDCLVTNNLACSANYGCDSYKCDYIGNPVRCLQHVGNHFDSTFVANGTEATAVGVIIYIDSGSMQLSNCVLRANSKKALCGYGGTYIDCLFEDNASAPFAAHANFAPTMRNCIFRRNTGLCAGNPKLVDGCLFEDNDSGSPVSVEYLKGGFESRIVNSTFRRNNAGTYKNGGAIWCSHCYGNETYFGTCFISNCVFECNVATSGGNNVGGAIYNGGEKATEQGKFPTATMPCDYTKVYDCTFTSNISVSCGGVYGVTAVRCKFEGNRKATPGSAWVASDAWKSKLTDCDMDGGGITDCFLDRCRIHDVSSSYSGGQNIFQDYIRATNTLVESCSASAIYGVLATVSLPGTWSYSNRRMDAEFVNCTFVTNSANTFSIPSSAIDATNGVMFANCLFYGNRNSSYATDLSAVAENNNTCYWDKVSFTRCCYKQVNASGIPQYATNPPPAEDFFQCIDPKFVKDSVPDAPYWSLTTRSPLLGKGDPLGFTTGDIDLAGRLRIRDGKIDIGCYQCWLNPPGFILVVK